MVGDQTNSEHIQMLHPVLIKQWGLRVGEKVAAIPNGLETISAIFSKAG